jgi:hypothetical protein
VATERRSRLVRLDLAEIGRRFERSYIGEVSISVLVTGILLIGVVSNLPASKYKEMLTPPLQPVAAATGLDSVWRMYAPDPIQRLERFEVTVTMSDGSTRVWVPPREGRIIGPYIWYHWQKLKEQAIYEPQIRAGIARWVVRELTTPSERAVRVRMTIQIDALPPPGSTATGRTWQETLYDEPLDPTHDFAE